MSRNTPPLPWLVAISVFATYLLAARGPGNLFPFSVFDMYQAHAPDVVARVLAIDAAGRAYELDAYDAWSCEWQGELQRAEATCGADHRPLDYVTRDQAHYLEQHQGEGDEAVRVVSRAYRVRDAGVFEDCMLATCRAHRR
jgi:hypothetical protein